MSKAAVSEIIDYMKFRNVEPVIVQEFPFRVEDMTPQLFSMRGAGAEAILLINSVGDDSRKAPSGSKVIKNAFRLWEDGLAERVECKS